MILIFSNLITGVLKKLITVIFSNLTIKNLNFYSISQIFSNLIINTFSLQGFPWWIVNLFSFFPFL